MRRRNALAVLVGLTTATLVAFCTDLLAILGSGEPDLGYLALSLGLGLAVAALAALPSLVAGAPVEVALALWTAGQLLPRALAWGPAGWLFPILLAGLTAVILRRFRSPGVGAAFLGAAVGLSAVAAVIGGPQLLSRLTGLRGDVAQGLATLGLFAALLVAAAWAARRTPSVRLLGPAAIVGSAALLIWVGAAAARSTERAELRAPAAREASDRPSILVLVLDTVRADALSLYGYGRATTPRLESWIATHDAAVYPSVYATASWSAPSHASLLTGRLPSAHGIHGASPRGSMTADVTLAELLARSGYLTGAFVANARLGAIPDLRRGFDDFDLPEATRPLYLVGEGYRRRWAPGLMADRVLPYPSAREINRRVVSFLDAAGDRPVFVLANYMEAHAPYAAPAPFRGRFGSGSGWKRPVRTDLGLDPQELRGTRDAYDEEISALDDAIVDLLEVLDSSGWLESSWLVVTSDHGESFGEHGVIEHGSSIYEQQVRVPLVIAPPRGWRLHAREEPVSLLDLSATLAEAGGHRDYGRGRSLLDAAAPRPAPFEFFGNWTGDDRRGARSDEPASGAVADRFKLIQRLDGVELYDLATDSAEMADLASARRDLVASLQALAPPVPDAAREGAGYSDGELTADQVEALRSLGYLD